MLYVLGVKDCDQYLPTSEEVVEMVKQSQQASQQAAEAAKSNPDPDTVKKLASANLDKVKADQITAEVAGNTASSQLEGYALIEEHKAKAYGQ